MYSSAFCLHCGHLSEDLRRAVPPSRLLEWSQQTAKHRGFGWKEIVHHDECHDTQFSFVHHDERHKALQVRHDEPLQNCDNKTFEWARIQSAIDKLWLRRAELWIESAVAITSCGTWPGAPMLALRKAHFFSSCAAPSASMSEPGQFSFPYQFRTSKNYSAEFKNFEWTFRSL